MTLTPTLKQREAKVRRLAAYHDQRVEKSRACDPNSPEYGGFMIIDVYTNTVICGGSPNAYSMTLEQVELFYADNAEPVELELDLSAEQYNALTAYSARLGKTPQAAVIEMFENAGVIPASKKRVPS